MVKFWKQICDVRQLPLTTPFEHDMKSLLDHKIYKHEEANVDIKDQNVVMENLCLKLTQNF